MKAERRKLVILIHGGSDVDSGSGEIIRRGFAEYGFEVQEVSVLDSGAKAKLQSLLRERRDDVSFFLSSNFWALNVRNGDALLHTLSGLPLVVLMHDHPLYFMHQISHSLDGVVIFAPGEDAADFIAKHYRLQAETVVNTAVLFAGRSQKEPDYKQFLSRKNALLCPMNLRVAGRTIEDVWAQIEALPPARRARTQRLIEASRSDSATPLHVVSERLTAAGDPELALQDLRPALDYVKLWRRTRLVEAIVELPSLISTSYVPPGLARRYPEKFKLLTMQQTLPLYREYRFVANSNPMLTGSIHDRITEALIHNAVCVTDANAIILRYFQDEKDMIFVGYEKDAIVEKVSRYLDDPERAFALTVNCKRARSQAEFSRNSYHALIEAVERNSAA